MEDQIGTSSIKEGGYNGGGGYVRDGDCFWPGVIKIYYGAQVEETVRGWVGTDVGRGPKCSQ